MSGHDEAARLRTEVAHLHSALAEAAGPRGSSCVTNEPDMTGEEWMRRQWRNAIDMWKFWRCAYENDVGNPAAPASWISWRKAALEAQLELDNLRTEQGIRAFVEEHHPEIDIQRRTW